jgi:hypothetical protein
VSLFVDYILPAPDLSAPVLALDLPTCCHAVSVPIQGLGIVHQHAQLPVVLPADQPLIDLNEILPLVRYIPVAEPKHTRTEKVTHTELK